MQPLVRRSNAPAWRWLVGAFGLVFAAAFAPSLGAVILAPLAALVGGGAAAHWSSRDTDRTLDRMAAVGAIVGVGAHDLREQPRKTAGGEAGPPAPGGADGRGARR